MAIYSAVPPPPALQPHQPTSQTAEIEAWTVSALQSLSVSSTSRGTGIPLSIPLDSVVPAEEAKPKTYKAATRLRREPSQRDSLRRRELLLKGKDGSRRRQRWENDRLLHVPNAQPPLPSDWEVRPTYPVHNVPYYLAPLWDAGVRQRAEHNASAKMAAAAKRAGVEEQKGRVPVELKQKMKKAKGAKNLLQELEERIRTFVRDWEEAEKRDSVPDMDVEMDSSDDEIIFVGRDGTMSDEIIRRERNRPQREKLIHTSLAEDHSASFGRWLVHSLAIYYGLTSRSITVGTRRQAFVCIKEVKNGRKAPALSELPRPLWAMV